MKANPVIQSTDANITFATYLFFEAILLPGPTFGNVFPKVANDAFKNPVHKVFVD